MTQSSIAKRTHSIFLRRISSGRKYTTFRYLRCHCRLDKDTSRDQHDTRATPFIIKSISLPLGANFRATATCDVTWPAFYPLYYSKKDSTSSRRIFFDGEYTWRRVIPAVAARLDKGTSRDQVSTKRFSITERDSILLRRISSRGNIRWYPHHRCID